jgi:hypothetical protein
MKRVALFFVFALVMLSEFVNAGWAPIDSPDNRTVYIDLTTAVRHGNVETIWVLIDRYTVQKEAGDSYLSSKGQWEIDCKANAARQIFHVIYPGHMGGGDTIWSGPLDQKFQPIVPDSIGESVFEVSCH